jgi:hypothetical protein
MKQAVQVVVVTLCLLMAVTLAGCGKIAERATEVAMEKSIESEGGDVDVDLNAEGGTFKVKDQETGEEIEITQGEDASFVMKTDEGTTVMSGDEESFVITSEDGTTTVTSGAGAKIPEGFPTDVPVYDGLVLEFASAQPSEGAYAVNGTTESSLEDVFSFYKEKLTGGGWSEEAAVTQPDMAFLAYKKENRSVNINLAQGEAGTNVAVAIYKEEPAE